MSVIKKKKKRNEYCVRIDGIVRYVSVGCAYFVDFYSSCASSHPQKWQEFCLNGSIWICGVWGDSVEHVQSNDRASSALQTENRHHHRQADRRIVIWPTVRNELANRIDILCASFASVEIMMRNIILAFSFRSISLLTLCTLLFVFAPDGGADQR